MDQMVLQKWDYCVEETSGADTLRSMLTRLGGEGWELVSVMCTGSAEHAGPVKTLRARKMDTYCAVFRRPG